MPALETMDLRQKALFWEKIGVTNYGQPRVDTSVDPVELSVRWEEVKKEKLTTGGQTLQVDAEVVVDREIPDQSLMWLGSLADLPDDLNDITDVMQVISVDEVPDLKNRNTRRVCLLMRYMDKLPNGTGD